MLRSKKSNGRVLGWEGWSTVADDEKRPSRIKPAEKMPVLAMEKSLLTLVTFSKVAKSKADFYCFFPMSP